MLFIQKQIICEAGALGIRHNTVQQFSGGPPLDMNGRRVLEFDISSMKINYFRLCGIRFQQNSVFPVTPPYGGSNNIDCQLEFDQIFLTSKTDSKNFYTAIKDQPIIMPLDQYRARIILTDFDDSYWSNVVQNFYNEFWTPSGGYTAVTQIKPHHIPDDLFYYDPDNYVYRLFRICALAELEALTVQQLQAAGEGSLTLKNPGVTVLGK